jgi:hypothetical protein
MVAPGGRLSFEGTGAPMFMISTGVWNVLRQNMFIAVRKQTPGLRVGNGRRMRGQELIPRRAPWSRCSSTRYGGARIDR